MKRSIDLLTLTAGPRRSAARLVFEATELTRRMRACKHPRQAVMARLLDAHDRVLDELALMDGLLRTLATPLPPALARTSVASRPTRRPDRTG